MGLEGEAEMKAGKEFRAGPDHVLRARDGAGHGFTTPPIIGEGNREQREKQINPPYSTLDFHLD